MYHANFASPASPAPPNSAGIPDSLPAGRRRAPVGRPASRLRTHGGASRNWVSTSYHTNNTLHSGVKKKKKKQKEKQEVHWPPGTGLKSIVTFVFLIPLPEPTTADGRDPRAERVLPRAGGWTRTRCAAAQSQSPMPSPVRREKRAQAAHTNSRAVAPSIAWEAAHLHFCTVEHGRSISLP